MLDQDIIQRRFRAWPVFMVGLILVISQQVKAAVTLSSVAGASNYNITSGTSPTIYGGVAGTCASYDTLNTCDSCANAVTLSACNRTRINAALRLRVSFKSTTASGRPIMTKSDGTTVVRLEPSSVSANSTATIDVPWGTVCSYLDNGAATCESATAYTPHTFKVGIDANNNGTIDTGDDTTSVQVAVYNPDADLSGTVNQIDDCATNGAGDNKAGICQFLAYPGDEKIFFEDSEGGSGFPTTAVNSTITKVNVYASSTGFINTPAEAAPKVLSVEQTSSGYEIANKIVDGLTNGVPTYFRVSVSDQAANEIYFTSDLAITTICGSLSPAYPFDGTGGGTYCPFAAIPDEVVGFLNKDMNCFIATAAFGSTLHPVVGDLREFRNHFLNPFKFGRRLINWYYSWSPDAAHWLRHHNWAKPVIQAALLPIWMLTRALMWWPITLTVLLLLFSIRWRRPVVKRAK